MDDKQEKWHFWLVKILNKSLGHVLLLWFLESLILIFWKLSKWVSSWLLSDDFQTLSREYLHFTDPHSSDRDIVYTLVSQPLYGSLILTHSTPHEDTVVCTERAYTERDFLVYVLLLANLKNIQCFLMILEGYWFPKAMWQIKLILSNLHWWQLFCGIGWRNHLSSTFSTRESRWYGDESLCS